MADQNSIAGGSTLLGVYCNLGAVHPTSGELGRAREAVETALKIAPGTPIAHLHLGSLEEESDNTARQKDNRFLATQYLDSAKTGELRYSLNLLWNST